MNKIEVLGKYSLCDKSWSNNDALRKISLAIANYDEIKNCDNEMYEYIILCYGCRLEDHSKDGYTIKNSAAHINRILNYYKGKNCNVRVKYVMLDKDAPLKEDGLVLAKYINQLCKDSNCNSVNIVGHSKAGVMFFDMIKHLDNNSLSKTNLYNVAVPYTGTKMASPKFIYNDIKIIIDSQIKNKDLADKIYKSTINFYEGISSNSHMDYDISLPGGVQEDRLDRYDSSIIENIFSKENINAMKNLNSFQNYITGIDETTLPRAIFTGDFTGIGLCIIDDVLMDRKSDGFVCSDAQRKVSNYMHNSHRIISGAHHGILSDELYCNRIFSDIYDNIEQNNEKKFVRGLVK